MTPRATEAERSPSPTRGNGPVPVLPVPSPRRERRIGRAGRVAIAFGACLLLLWLLRVPLLVSVGRLLSVSEPPEPADVIYQFGGANLERSQLSADLYRRGFAPRIVLMRVYHAPYLEGVVPNETDVSVEILLRSGVPRSAISVYHSGDGVSSTTEEAQAIAPLLRRDGTRRVLAVTSWYHTRRARWALRRALDGAPIDISMAGVASVDWNVRNWWRHESGVLSIVEEYVKFVHNSLYR